MSKDRNRKEFNRNMLKTNREELHAARFLEDSEEVLVKTEVINVYRSALRDNKSIADARAAAITYLMAHKPGLGFLKASIMVRRFVIELRSVRIVRGSIQRGRRFVRSIADIKFRPKNYASTNTAVYVSSDSLDDAKELFSRTITFLNELGYELQDADKWQQGSWWRRAKFAVSTLASNKTVTDRAQIIEDVLFGKESLEVAAGIANATVGLIDSLRDHKGTVAIDAGLFLFLKIPREDGEADIFAKRLSVEERAFLDSDPKRVSKPDELFEAISDLKKVVWPKNVHVEKKLDEDLETRPAA